MNIPVRKRIKAVLGRAAGLTGLYAREFRSMMVIVAFHRVNDQLPEDALTVSSEKFEGFCRYFRKHFRIVPLSEQVAACHAGRQMGGTLSITFDDGYRDSSEVAAPILKRLRLPATFFVTSGYLGTSFVAPWDRELVSPPSWMDWDQVRALKADGFEIGAHTDSHIDMGTADPETVRTELGICKERLREELGSPVSLFAYPFGGRENISPTSLQMVRGAGFSCCLACFGGINPPVADPFHLKRIGIGQWYATPHHLGYELLAGSV